MPWEGEVNLMPRNILTNGLLGRVRIGGDDKFKIGETGCLGDLIV